MDFHSILRSWTYSGKICAIILFSKKAGNISVIFSQAVISEEESQQDQEEEDQESASQEQYDSEQQPPEEQDQQQQQRQQQTQEDSPPLPPGMELVDPKQLGLSDGDVSKYFGNVKHLQTLNLPGYG